MSSHPPNQSRRRILKAAGLSLSLPMLSSLGDLACVQNVQGGESAAREPSPPKRFCSIFFPNGVSLPPEDHPAHHDWSWFPHEVGANFRFTETLRPLEKLRGELSILSGLSHPSMRSTIAHITADSFLTGADSSTVYTNSISLDQLIATRIGQQTRFASLVLSSDGGIGAPGRTHTLSFSASGRPIPSLSNPRKIFNRLFGVREQSIEQQRRSFGRDRSILDHLLDETNAIESGLSAADRQRFDEYTASVREIEQRLSHADQWLDAQRPQVDPAAFDLDATQRGDAGEYIRVILDLMHMALLTDSTRAITYQITSEDAKGIGDRFPNSLGLPGHHSLSHGIGEDDGYQKWARYDQFLATQLAHFVDRLKRTDDPFQEGSLLDNTIVLYGGSTSRTHQAVNYPLVLAGGASMGLRHGQHYRFNESKQRLSNLYVTLLQQLGLKDDRFADSTGTLSELLG